MKKAIILIVALICLFAISSCQAVVPSASSSTVPGGSTSDVSSTDAPDFAENAFMWNATAEAGKTRIDSKYRIIIEEGNDDASTAAQILRLGINSVLGSSLRTTNDKLDNNPEIDKEILLGTVNNRSQSSHILDVYAEQLSAYTLGVGSFFVGANDSKIMILAEDDSSLSAAASFFVTNYVRDRETIEIESDLCSLYFYDKFEYQSEHTVSALAYADLLKNVDVLDICVNGEPMADFDEGVRAYRWLVERSETVPELSVNVYSPFANKTVVQATSDNNWTAHISVQSGVGDTTIDYSIAVSRLEYDNINATLHKLKNGATGAITLVGDDGYREATEIMLEVCQKYGAKFNIAMSAKNVGQLVKENGEYVFNDDGTYKTDILSGASWWQQIVEQNTNTIEITSHTLSHSAFNRDETEMKAEIYGSQQVLRDAFPSQRVLTFAYAGYDGSGNESDMVKAALPGHYIASRGGSSAKYNNLQKHNIYQLECCSLYYNDPATWGTGASNNDGWLMRAINEACTNGGWVVTMNHNINRVNNGLTEGNMTIDMEMFEHVVRDYMAPKMQSGVLWNGFFSEVAQYVTEYNSSNLICRSYEDGVILIDLTDKEDDALFDYALTLDIPVDESWSGAKLTYTGRDGSAVEEVLTISTAADGTRYIRIQLVPDCGTATLTKGN